MASDHDCKCEHWATIVYEIEPPAPQRDAPAPVDDAHHYNDGTMTEGTAPVEPPADLELLRSIEWVRYQDSPWWCPSCRYWRRQGHASDCRLAAALAPPATPNGVAHE